MRTGRNTTRARYRPASTENAPHRTWGQRLTIGGVFLAAIGCFAAGGGLYAAQQVIEDRNVVVLAQDPEEAAPETPSFETAAPSDEPQVQSESEPRIEAGPPETFPLADPAAKNILITGADNNSCIDPESEFAGAFGDRASFGERSDTIMMWRVNPAASQVAVLSFPRDLWVNIAGRSSKQRINAAYERDQPQRLIDTIDENFGIETDHFIQFDFCAFKTLVDAVDGIAVPFEQPVRDVNTGLFVPDAGCFTFTGDHALAYVRSRKIQVFQDDGTWSRSDGTSDLGRISRQQDFIRRTADSLLAAGAFDPAVIRALVETSDDFVLNDSALTINRMLEFAGVIRNVNPESIHTYQVESRPTTIQGNAVLQPRLSGSNMQAILQIFSGEATLAEAPEQVFEDEATTTSAAEISDDSGDDAVTQSDALAPTDEPAPSTTVEPVPFTPLPEVEAEESTFGVVPDASVTCG